MKKNEKTYKKNSGKYNVVGFGDESRGKAEIHINDESQRKHTGYWGDTHNQTLYYQNENKNPDVIGFISWGTKYFGNIVRVFLGAIEIMNVYRGQGGFKQLIRAFHENSIQPIVKKYGENNVFIDADFTNPNVKEYLIKNSKQDMGVYIIDEYIDKVAKNKIKEIFTTGKDVEFFQYIGQFKTDQDINDIIDHVITEEKIIPNETILDKILDWYPNIFSNMIDANIIPSKNIIEKAIDINYNFLRRLVLKEIPIEEEIILKAVRKNANAIAPFVNKKIKLSDIVYVEAVRKNPNVIQYVLDSGIKLGVDVYIEAINNGWFPKETNPIYQVVVDFKNGKITKEELEERVC